MLKNHEKVNWTFRVTREAMKGLKRLRRERIP